MTLLAWIAMFSCPQTALAPARPQPGRGEPGNAASGGAWAWRWRRLQQQRQRRRGPKCKQQRQPPRQPRQQPQAHALRSGLPQHAQQQRGRGAGRQPQPQHCSCCCGGWCGCCAGGERQQARPQAQVGGGAAATLGVRVRHLQRVYAMLRCYHMSCSSAVSDCLALLVDACYVHDLLLLAPLLLQVCWQPA